FLPLSSATHFPSLLQVGTSLNMATLRRHRSELLLSKEIPFGATEYFITSGYRALGSSPRDCLRSAFMFTNETLNFWTHFGPLLFCLAKFASLLSTHEHHPLHSQLYPLYAYAAGVSGVFALSSLAHLFNALSLRARDIWYCLDYGAVSLYGAGSSLAYYHFINPHLQVGMQNLNPIHTSFCSLLHTMFKPLSFLFACVCLTACCLSRRGCWKHRYLVRTLVFLLPQTLTLPVIAELTLYGKSIRKSLAGGLFIRHWGWLVLAGLFNITKIPERLKPGTFDIVGHSHQWFHVFTFLSIFDEILMMEHAMTTRPLPATLIDGLTPTSAIFASTVGFLAILAALMATFIAAFCRWFPPIFDDKKSL
uniref:Progestin and adipoQ receptor family member 9 n=1 Tax=Eptatretus burgeri TaxID=7764 RepID=A0A8C4N095_EPTBU